MHHVKTELESLAHSVPYACFTVEDENKDVYRIPILYLFL